MFLITSLKVVLVSFLILSLAVIAIIMPTASEIPISSLTNSYLLGYAQIKLNWQDEGIKSLIQNRFNLFKKRQSDLGLLEKIFCAAQDYAIAKLLPYYVSVFFYGAKESEKPTFLLVINPRINRLILKPFVLLAVKLSANCLKKEFYPQQPLQFGTRKYQLYRLAQFWFMFHSNLCLITDTLIAFKYFFSDTPFQTQQSPLPPNISKMDSLLNSKSNCRLIFDNRLKTGQSVYEYLAQNKFSFTNELATNFFQTWLFRFKIYSDSIIISGIEADIVTSDQIVGKWLIIMNNESAAQKFAMVVDGTHQVVSQELGKRNILYSVKRTINQNRIISDFTIKGVF